MNIKLLRIKNGLSQSELSRQIGVSRQVINTMENKPYYIAKKRTVKKLCDFFGCSILELCNGRELLAFDFKTKEEISRAIELIEKFKEESL